MIGRKLDHKAGRRTGQIAGRAMTELDLHDIVVEAGVQSCPASPSTADGRSRRSGAAEAISAAA